MKFLLAYASRSRPRLFQKRVANWAELASGNHELIWRCSFDNDDESMNSFAMQQWCKQKGLDYRYGANTGKIAAINACMYEIPPFDVAIIVSDDMAVVAPGWDEIVAVDMSVHFSKCNGALWYPDGFQSRICTLSIMGRPVYEELGHLYHPDFESVYCDNWYHEVMVRSNRLQKINRQVFRHQWRKENNDALMRRNEGQAVYRRDKQVFVRLMKEHYGVDVP